MNKARLRVVLKPGQRSVGEPAAGKATCRMKAETNGKSTTAFIAPHADTSRRQVQRKVSSLRPHPLQAQLFSNLPDAELQLLAANLERNGQIDDIEIVGDNLVICGWQRTRAMKLLGWKKARCWIRDDLDALGDEAIERRLIEDNLHRRQLTKLEQARSYQRLRQLERGRRGTKGGNRGDMRDFFAKQFGVSGRTLDRWERVLAIPIEIQDAVSRKKLSFKAGSQVAALPKGVQQQIAAEIRAGKDPEKVVARRLVKKEPSRAPETDYRHMRGSLKQAVVGLPNGIEGNASVYEADLPMLRKGRAWLRTVIMQIKAACGERNGT